MLSPLQLSACRLATVVYLYNFEKGFFLSRTKGHQDMHAKSMTFLASIDAEIQRMHPSKGFPTDRSARPRSQA
jgi:hypothetical protein